MALFIESRKEEGDEATAAKATGVAFAAVAVVRLQCGDIYIRHTLHTLAKQICPVRAAYRLGPILARSLTCLGDCQLSSLN